MPANMKGCTSVWPRILMVTHTVQLNLEYLVSAFITCRLNFLPNDLSKLKAFADDKSNVTLKKKWVGGRVENILGKLKIVLRRVENIVGKGENAGFSIISFSHNVFKRFPTQGR